MKIEMKYLLSSFLMMTFCFVGGGALARAPQASELLEESPDQEYLQEFIGLCNENHFGFHASTNASSLFEYISLGKELGTSSKTDYEFFRLLTNRLKGVDAEVIMAPVLEMLVTQIPLAISRHTMSLKSWSSRQEEMQADLESRMMHHFDGIVTQIQVAGRLGVAQKLSEQIGTIANSYFPDPFSESFDGYWVHRLRSQVKTLLELSIQRLMWEPSAYQGIWNSVNKVAFGFYNLCNEQVVCHSDDLDDLLWSLTYRFKYFLRLMGHQFPSSFYKNIEFHIVNGYSSWISFEVDAGIRTKKSVLLEEIFTQKMRALAYERNGILPPAV
ncbi:hypothetical protein JKY79_02750 [Candidatus Babeliales bacterium]|nr:hypothetical protein [Candidatus Babeliales bacterium]